MKPEKLSWVTIPLIVLLILNLLYLLLLPFLGVLLNGIIGADPELDPAALGIASFITGSVLWVSAFFIIAWSAFLFFTYRAVTDGKAWGRIAAIVIFILSLFSFPIGTLLGIFGLIGAFDEHVQRYTSR